MPKFRYENQPERLEIDEYKVGDRVESTLNNRKGTVIEHPEPEIQPKNTVYVKLDDQEIPLNCSANNLIKLSQVEAEKANNVIEVDFRPKTGTHN